MPELPEVETTRRGIAPYLEGQAVQSLLVRESRLRWPIPAHLTSTLAGAQVLQVSRRGKFLLIQTDRGTALSHLGMSGSLRVLTRPEAPEKHDHFDLITDAGSIIRYRDPRRFGALLWAGEDHSTHPMIARMGPEPLSDDFDGQHLFAHSRGRKGAVKNFIMNGEIVVGVGNIYACESLFSAAIHPRRPAGRISLARYELLADEIKKVLAKAIEMGGTTLRDFVNGSGQAGYFKQSLNVYDREGQPCVGCAKPIRREVIGQRSTYFCAGCQR